MNKRTSFWIGLIIIIVAGAIALNYYYNKATPILVQIGQVEQVPVLTAKVNASGEIKPKEYVELQSEISGVITALFVKEGDPVTKGHILLTIDPTQPETQTRAQEALLQVALMEVANAKTQIALQEVNLDREKANLRAVEADLRKAHQVLEFNTNNFVRKQELFEQNLISRDLYETAKNELVAAETNLVSAKARLEQARASLNVAQLVLKQNQNSLDAALSRVNQSRASLDQALDSLSKTVIRSPLTGIITQLNVEVGERAVPGTLNNPAATIMVIADLSVIEAEVEVNETDIVAVGLNQPAIVQVDALSNQPISGTVTEIGNSAMKKQTGQEAKEFKVVIRLDNPPQSLRPGLSCTADITTSTRKDVLAIPIQALVVRELAFDVKGNPIHKDQETTEQSKTKREFEGVFLFQDDFAKFRSVKTGIYTETQLEIISGVDSGLKIVTGSYKALRELQHDEPVRVQKGQESPLW